MTKLQQREEDIAVVGLAGRFPGARDVDQLWDNLRQGKEALTLLSDEDLRAEGVSGELLREAKYVKAAMKLDDIDRFDAEFFGYNPRQAALLDPQKRLFMECAWEAIENAGYDVAACGEFTGVFAGSSTSGYLFENSRRILQSKYFAERFQAIIDLDKDFLTTQTSYKLNLGGPSVAVQSACSTSLVAVHMACQSLLNFECDMALAGGVSIRLWHGRGHVYDEGGILSPDGHCRALDADANGVIFGSGAAIVVLKRLADARAGRDNIWAVVRGSAVNNDGSRKVGYSAPSFHGQARVIAMALSAADAVPDEIGMIEAHGTGTVLGDEIELAALTEVFKHKTSRRRFCSIGSIKTNIGHLDTAAGVVGLVKAVLCLKNKALVASLNFKNPNKILASEESPFYVNDAYKSWDLGSGKRLAGVSSFGIGGTNAHVVLEEAPERACDPASGGDHIFPFSARNAEALSAARTNLRHFLGEHPEVAHGDVAYTLQVGRSHFAHRSFVVADGTAAVVGALKELSPVGVAAEDLSVAFLFQGIGFPRVGMAAALYRTDALFRATINQCLELFGRYVDADFASLINAPGAVLPSSRRNTLVGQLALFSIQYALAHRWLAWGVRPAAMIGHSLGEYAAACIAGVLSLEDAVVLVATRARAMASLPPGFMAAVNLSEDELAPLLRPPVCLAAVNTPSQSIISGPIDATKSLISVLSARGVQCTELAFAHALHSGMMAPASEMIARVAARITINAPNIPYVSCVTGRWITEADVRDPAYWAAHVRNTVRYSTALRELTRSRGHLLLEVGPGEVLVNLARQQLGADVSTLRSLEQGSESDRKSVLRTLGKLWVRGAKIDWHSLHRDASPSRVALPTYPFQKQHYWIEQNDELEVRFAHPGVGGVAPRERRPRGREDDARMDAEPSDAVAPAPVHSVAPRNDLERAIIGIWEEILGRGGFGVHDDFFGLGGDSLGLLRVLSRIRDEFDVTMSIAKVATSSRTIADMAIKVVAEASADEDDAVAEELPAALASPEPVTREAYTSRGDVAQEYIRRAERAVAEIAGMPPSTRGSEVKKIAVVGAGTMARGISMCFADAGIPVVMIGREPDAVRHSVDEILRTSTTRKERALVTGDTDLAAAFDADLVIEAIIEDIDAKKEIFGSLDRIVAPNTILATNTSYLDIDVIAGVTKRPRSVVGMHFSNPADIMRVLEVVRGAETAPSVLATAVATGRRLGKVPVVVGVCHGFVGNRMLSARSSELERILIEGALPEEVDDALRGFGFPIGPCATADLAGLDVGWRVRRAKGVRAEIADALCEQSRFGRKSGSGFYHYGPDGRASSDPAVARLIVDASRRHGIVRRLINHQEIVERIVFPMINEGARIVEEGVAARVSDIDLIWVHGYGFPSHRGGPMFYAGEVGLRYVCRRLEAIAANSGDPRLQPAPLLRRLAALDETFDSAAVASVA